MSSRTTRSLALCSALLVGLAAPPSASAQLGERAVPGVYAITNARVVPVSGPTLDRATVVVRDGLISAVGTSVGVPADARIIDGAGLTVYPGFIDALTSLGVPAPRQQGSQAATAPAFATAPSQQQPVPTAPNSVYPAGLQPELRAIDLLRFDGDALDSHRGVGITTALVAPRDGIFQGQSALINLAGANVQDMIVRSPAALHVGFTPMRGGSYPNSLLGVFSSLRQMLLDAQRYREANAAYARNPRGMRRPDNDPSLAALVPALSKEIPVVMLANTQREIERALGLASEFGLRAYIAGAEEGWMIADRLRRENVPVIATLNFPRRSGSTTEDADPEPLRVLRSRVEAPRNPGKLATAGVRVAFTSGGASNMSDFLTNLRKAVTNGLSRDQAIRALTLTPADLYGVADRLGSIEVGKIANLTIVRGDLFDAAGRVTQVFIDGRPLTVRAPTESATGAGASGTWTITATFVEGERTVTLNLQQDGERLRGTIQGSLGSSDISNASIGSGGDLRFTVPVTLGNTSEEATFTGTLTGNVMRGAVQIVGRPNGTFVGTRPGPSGSERTPVRPPR